MRREDPPDGQETTPAMPPPPDSSTSDLERGTERGQDTEADRKHMRELQKARQARLGKVIVGLGIVVLLVIFITSNSDPAKVSFVFFDARPRLIWVMFACAVLGGILGYLIARPSKQVRLHRREQERGK